MIDITVSERDLLIKLLRCSIDFSLSTAYIDMDMTPREQEIAYKLLKKLQNYHI